RRVGRLSTAALRERGGGREREGEGDGAKEHGLHRTPGQRRGRRRRRGGEWNASHRASEVKRPTASPDVERGEWIHYTGPRRPATATDRRGLVRSQTGWPAPSRVASRSATISASAVRPLSRAYHFRISRYRSSAGRASPSSRTQAWRSRGRGPHQPSSRYASSRTMTTGIERDPFVRCASIRSGFASRPTIRSSNPGTASASAAT